MMIIVLFFLTYYPLYIRNCYTIFTTRILPDISQYFYLSALRIHAKHFQVHI